MSLSTEIESLYESVKAKFSEAGLPLAVHDFFMSEAEKAKAAEAVTEAAEQAIRDKVQAEIDHLTALGYSVVKAAPAPVVGAPIA